MFLNCVTLFYHPSCDHLDSGPDIESKYFVLTETPPLDKESLVRKVVEHTQVSHYRHEVDSIQLLLDVEDVARVLKAVGARVIE